MTEWRPIPSFPGHEASEYGEIRRGTKIIKPRDNGRGYLSVGFRYVHRLVCEAFHGPMPPDKEECRHLDGTRRNNGYRNLAWASKLENEADKIAHGTHPTGERNHQAKLTEGIVIAGREMVRAGASIKEAAAARSLPRLRLGAAIRGNRWGHLAGAIPAKRRQTPPHTVAAIKRHCEEGKLSHRAIGKLFGVSHQAVWKIAHGRRHASITTDESTYRDLPAAKPHVRHRYWELVEKLPAMKRSEG